MEELSLHRELATLLGPRKPREGVTQNDQWIAAVGELLARAERAESERDAYIERLNEVNVQRQRNEVRAIKAEEHAITEIRFSPWDWKQDPYGMGKGVIVLQKYNGDEYKFHGHLEMYKELSNFLGFEPEEQHD